MKIFSLLLFLACDDTNSTNQENTQDKQSQYLASKQDKLELAALFDAFNAKDFYGQKLFEETWAKLDEKHQIEALEIIRKGHRFEVSIDITPIVESHKAIIAQKGENADNKAMQESAQKAALDIAQHAFYLRQAIVLWNVAKSSNSTAIQSELGYLEQELKKSIPHFAQLLRFVDVYSLIPTQDSLPCDDLARFHCELEGDEYSVLRIHVQKDIDPTEIQFDPKSLDFLRFQKIHFMIDGQEDINLQLTPNPILDFENPKYVEELFDFLAAYGNYRMEYDNATQKYKFIQQK